MLSGFVGRPRPAFRYFGRLAEERRNHLLDAARIVREELRRVMLARALHALMQPPALHMAVVEPIRHDEAEESDGLMSEWESDDEDYRVGWANERTSERNIMRY